MAFAPGTNLSLMDNQVAEGDRLFLIAESLAQDFSLFPSSGATGIEHHVRGLLSRAQIARQLELLNNLDIDSYIETVVAKAEDPGRLDAPSVIRQLGGRLSDEKIDGPFYSAMLEMDFGGEPRTIAFIAQDRSVKNGVWMPQHHLAAAAIVGECSKRNIAIVSLMDTPGADAEEAANKANQAHSISRLIAEMCNVDVPNIGIVFGLGYSGGAIPLAASNLILSVRDGVFSTIQPKGLANIARRLNLSWQECAKYVGLSPYELYAQGNIDGIIDYAPGDGDDKLENLRLAIVSGLQSVEDSTKQFVAENPYILDHYRHNLERYLKPSKRLQAMESRALLRVSKTPTEYTNVFGVAYRYLRYLGTRKRIKATTTKQYGRLSAEELPKGELEERSDRERRQTFLKWLQDPEKVIYDDALAKAWRVFDEKRQVMDDERGRIAQLLFGEPRKNYEDARVSLLTCASMYLYNRWKGEAQGSLKALIQYLRNHQDSQRLLRTHELKDPRAFAQALAADRVIGPLLRERFSHEGKKLLSSRGLKDKSDAYLRNQLTAEINLALTDDRISDLIDDSLLSTRVKTMLAERRSDIAINRQIFDDRYSVHLGGPEIALPQGQTRDVTVLDVLVDDDLREDFIGECENLLLFDSVYDQIIENLDTIAEEAESTRALSKRTITRLLDVTLAQAARMAVNGAGQTAAGDAMVERLRGQFFRWFLRVAATPKSTDFFRAVEEWKKASFPHLSDTLFVVVTFLFERLLGLHLQSEKDRRRYDGRISPRAIGRRKDFWNRLTIAYRDLRIQQLVEVYKGRKATGYKAVMDAFFSDFEELYGDLLSSDPCEFPGFRISIESALKNKIPPCGIVTGIGTFNDGAGGFRVGAVISNIDFQAGAFDMASAEKFCKLLVDCAERELPVIGFISSGGMQTKEGAGALFSMAAVNDRITRFVRDSELPVIMFGFGDCTGGAQASFVTHPLVQTYYFSGTNMPFAGQIVVQSNLPSTATMSNYLSAVPGAMQGLVKHPFFDDLDDRLRKIDPEIPLPTETVVEVVHRVMAGSLSLERPQLAGRRPKFRDRELIRPIERVLIHARGCTAVKLIRVAQRNAIEVVLVQSDPDMDSVAVDMLTERDRVVCIGGNTPDESYLNAMSVLRVAEHENVDSLHPGIGFLSENSQFAELCRSHGINFVGPPVASMEAMGNKSNAINTALRLQVPVVPGSHGILTNVERAAEVAAQIGYPVLIKAVHGGGGKGIQVVETADDFDDLFYRVIAEARSAFGSGDVYLEKYVRSLRHIEAQLLRDNHGNAKVLGLRDCSVQRDKQKIFEESDSTMLPDELRDAVLQYTAAIADEVGYVGAGTVEFIFDLKARAVYFMEMNTRLQVEHPVTELVSGVDIVAQQFRIASGESIAKLEIGQHGYAIEARINAERIVVGAGGKWQFRPDPGQITECVLPEEAGIEIIACAAPGKFVSPYYDSMVAQVIAHGTERHDTIDKLLNYLERVRITGICTNISMLKMVLNDSVFRDGTFDTNFLPEFLGRIDANALIKQTNDAAGKSGAGIDRNAITIEGSDELKVLSPSTGIFYITPSPTEPEFVAVGDRIKVGDTLCQLEAMKIFTPLALKDFNTPDHELYPSNQRYEVTRINNAGGQQVNVGDLLFVVKPVS
jgi:acetyl/propionyl-CoA carboxylase alpha subunit/acetyl-CoA carboxylase beta subunit